VDRRHLLVGAVAISGLPPLNGFVSELLIYLGAFQGVAHGDATIIAPLLCVIGALALIGGLAAACFTKAFGIVFCGEPRGPHAVGARECALAMRLPMVVLAAGCVAIGVGAPLVMRGLAPVLVDVVGLSPAEVAEHIAAASDLLSAVALSFLGLIALAALASVLRRMLLSGRAVKESVTWDCGYARPTPRMQYSASSFAQPLTDFFAPLLQTRRHLAAVRGLFPQGAELMTDTLDVCTERLYVPLFSSIERGLTRLRWVQHGRVHLYVLYVALTLVVLLVWKLG
jgi:NADH:ubiquinone oxidoreductase subunit 5 (subunit L)/multisubunit Na+/H+ antiporter MnhA subunit